MRDFVTTDVSILGAPLVVMGLARLWAGARAANYVWPFFNVVVSNVPGPRQPMYCVGAKATHYFPVSIPYHGGALNVTVHSYLDKIEFGLIACSETVPDAQRIADFVVEDFAAMQKADAEYARPDVVGRIAVEQGSKPSQAPKPVRLGEVKAPEASPPKPQKKSELAREVDALGAATAELMRQLEAKGGTPAAPAEEPKTKPPAAKVKVGAKRSDRRGAEPTSRKAPAKTPRSAGAEKTPAGKPRRAPRRSGRPKA